MFTILVIGLLITVINMFGGLNGIQYAIAAIGFTSVILFLTSVFLLIIGKGKIKEPTIEVVFAVVTAPVTIIFLWMIGKNY